MFQIRIELLCGIFRRIPPNTANVVAVLEGSTIRYGDATRKK